jgi:cellulose synthase/poly-beta-1,6-N-acetylglucosamine synthase-like glycosyltransferase
MRQEQLFFSIIIPTYARPGQLAACLQALARLDYPRDRFEVIVVDDGSETPLEDVVAPFCNQLDVTLVTQVHAGPAAARNTGATRAKGEFLAFTDDDCAPASDWLQVLAAHFARASDYAIGGRTLNALPDNPYSTASQLLVACLYIYYNADPDQARFFTSNNLALPADRFHAMGGFDTTYTRTAAEDREFCDRWLHHGYRMAYVPEATVYHAHELTFRTFWQQHLNYGRGAFQFRQVRACRDRGHIKLEPVSFYLNLLRYPFLQARGWQALSLAALLVVAQVANAVGFLWEYVDRSMEKSHWR